MPKGLASASGFWAARMSTLTRLHVPQSLLSSISGCTGRRHPRISILVSCGGGLVFGPKKAAFQQLVYQIVSRQHYCSALCRFSTSYCNLAQLRQDTCGLDIAEVWCVTVPRHFIRKSSYKGSRNQVSSSRLRLPYDGMTYPAALFTATRQQWRRNRNTFSATDHVSLQLQGGSCSADSRLQTWHSTGLPPRPAGHLAPHPAQQL